MFYIQHGFAHILITMHVDRVPPWTIKQSTLYLGETIGVQQVSTWRLLLLLSVFALLYTLHMSKFYMPTFVNHWNNSKTAPITLYFVRLSILGKPVFVYNSAISSMVNTNVKPHRIACSTSLTSFVHVGSISMLTHRPCHGPWTLNTFRSFHSISSPNMVIRVLGRKYCCQIFIAML